jgi:SAM-dependent methyltransferase
MTTDDSETLAAAWERHADDWGQWARTPGHDSYWRFHRDKFLRLIPPPGRRTLDLGCGEGRLSRDLKALGHRVTAVDRSETLARLAAEADSELDVRVADAARLPFEDGDFDLVVAFMSLMDMDDMAGSAHEAARVLEPGGSLVVAVVHPINSAGTWADEDDPESPFALSESYFERRRYADSIEREGLRMTFSSIHWTFEDYVELLLRAGFELDAVREVTDDGHLQWRRAPMFLHLRGVRGKASQPG